jgi:phosphodiesterase/alkaline phosphatase D-like protein
VQAYYEWMPVRPVDTANRRKNNRLRLTAIWLT